MTSTAIPTMNNPAIPMSTACAVFFLAHVNEKQGQKTARSFRQLRRLHHGISSDEVFGTHTAPMLG
jgi:hypothetical protein